MIDLKSNFDDIARDISSTPRKIAKSASRAVNKAGQKVRVDSGRRVAKEAGIRKSKSVREQITQVKANERTLTSYVKYKERGFGISESKRGRGGRVRKDGTRNYKFNGKIIEGVQSGNGGLHYIKRNKKGAKNLFAYTLIQELRHHRVLDDSTKQGAQVAVREFIRQLKL